ncbi:hypothetical protein JD969_03960 [Planctomycetota bacterium]|nr:hypothetical protein JD969_03960 [Planctomycetota bacterium]
MKCSRNGEFWGGFGKELDGFDGGKIGFVRAVWLGVGFGMKFAWDGLIVSNGWV